MPVVADEAPASATHSAARQALEDGDAQQAVNICSALLKQNQADTAARVLRAEALEKLSDFDGAIDDWSALIASGEVAASPRTLAALLQRRGDCRLFAARFSQAIEDFDRVIELLPERMAGHWQRGIACYYAGEFASGAKQFEAYQAVDRNDVENSVWWFLCRARVDGIESARRGLLPVGRDTRVPLMVIYELFRDHATPEEVLAAVEAGEPSAEERRQRLFYAHLYLGLWHEALGRPRESLHHMRLAADEYNIGGYMWQVSRLHKTLREAELR